MFNPFKKAKKAVDTKLKKAAAAALIGGMLTAAAYRFDLPIAKDTLDQLAAALSGVVVEVMDEQQAPEQEAEPNADGQ